MSIDRARLLALVEPRKVHMAVNVAQRREGGVVPACDGEDCGVCRVIADELAALLPPVGQEEP